MVVSCSVLNKLTLLKRSCQLNPVQYILSLRQNLPALETIVSRLWNWSFEPLELKFQDGKPSVSTLETKCFPP